MKLFLTIFIFFLLSEISLAEKNINVRSLSTDSIDSLVSELTITKIKHLLELSGLSDWFEKPDWKEKKEGWVSYYWKLSSNRILLAEKKDEIAYYVYIGLDNNKPLTLIWK